MATTLPPCWVYPNTLHSVPLHIHKKSYNNFYRIASRIYINTNNNTISLYLQTFNNLLRMEVYDGVRCIYNTIYHLLNSTRIYYIWMCVLFIHANYMHLKLMVPIPINVKVKVVICPLNHF